MEPLDELARLLAKNYFDTSLTFTKDEERDAETVLRNCGRIVFADDGEVQALQPQERTVLVLGSGASIGAFGSRSFPGTADAITRIKTKLDLHKVEHHAVKAIADTYDRMLNEIKGKYDYPDAPIDFETNLGVLAELFGDSLITQRLAEMYGDRYNPHLAFEIIAHLFKHRFIDVIINFNFDELLDEAIEGEMGTGQYHNVLFDGECRGLAPLLIDNRLKVPLYIKPHGTVSYPSSMRFTKDHYFQLPGPMRDLMASVIAGEWWDAPKGTSNPLKPRKVNIITVGFSMKSVDLLEIMHARKKTDEQRITLFHINVEEGIEQLKKLGKVKGWDKMGISQRFIDVDAKEHQGLSQTFRALWQKTRDSFKEECRPRGIARHEILHALFFTCSSPELPGERVPAANQDPQYPSNKDFEYLRARLYAEVAMALARGNGQIDLSTMSDSRVGVYFDHIRNCQAGGDISMHDVLTHFADGGEVELVGPDSSIFRIRHPNVDDAGQLNAMLATTLWERLARGFYSTGDGRFRGHVREIDRTPERRQQMIYWLTRLVSSDAQDISPNFQHSRLLLSREPQSSDVLHTSLGLTLRFVRMLNKHWDMMVAVSEHGKLLEKYQRHVRVGNITHDPNSKLFCLVLAASTVPGVVRKRLDEFPGQLLRPKSKPYFEIPAWVHNQHMVLLLKRVGNDYVPVAGVRYEKFGLGNRVNPIFIQGSDLNTAFSCFKRYLYMSEHGIPGADGRPAMESEADLREKTEAIWNDMIAEIEPRSVPA